MFSTPRPSFAATLLFASLAPALRADWRDDVGYNRLIQTIATGVPNAASNGLAQVEALENNVNYAPDSADSRFSGKTLNLLSGSTGVSGHATGVASYFYGNSGSLAPATSVIDVYTVSNATLTGWLNISPYADTRLVQNHSWVARAENFASGTDLNAQALAADLRVDTMANLGSIIVAGVDNGSTAALPVWLCQGYNLISVGRSDGQHSAGYTSYDGANRIKPDIVSPETTTSGATGQVSSAAALLAQKLTESPYSRSGADLPRVTKALLLAGATKDKFPSWSRNSTQPIDLRYGAGETNVLLSYRMLVAGPATASSNTTVPDTAWAVGQVKGAPQAVTQAYFFDVPTGAANSRFSAALVWHRPATSANGSFSYNTPANLSLTLYSATNFTVGTAVSGGASDSAADNLEHIYLPSLAAGRYALRVASSTSRTTTDFALAWRTLPTVTVAATTATASEQTLSAGRFTITRTGPTTSPLLVPLSWNGTAIAGNHYATPPSSVLIPVGSSNATVDITPVADSLAQGARSVVLSLVDDFSLSAGASANATVTIQDKPYDAWRFARFSSTQLADSAVSGESADPDGDGLSNLLEYALGGEPLSADSAAHQPAVGLSGDGRLALTYFQPSDVSGIAYSVEWTSDLAAGSWQSGAGIVTETARVAATGGALVTVRADAYLSASPRQFLRLRVSRQ